MLPNLLASPNLEMNIARLNTPVPIKEENQSLSAILIEMLSNFVRWRLDFKMKIVWFKRALKEGQAVSCY